jgi:hypothetical protein
MRGKGEKTADSVSALDAASLNGDERHDLQVAEHQPVVVAKQTIVAALEPGRTPEMKMLPKRGVDRGAVILCMRVFLRSLDRPGCGRIKIESS